MSRQTWSTRHVLIVESEQRNGEEAPAEWITTKEARQREPDQLTRLVDRLGLDRAMTKIVLQPP